MAVPAELDSSRYMEATKLRDMPSMDWTDARVALKRLVIDLRVDVYYRRRYRSSEDAAAADLVALAEFALTARGFDFAGKKGENTTKFRKELVEAATLRLHPPLANRLTASAQNAQITAKPITEYMRFGAGDPTTRCCTGSCPCRTAAM